MARRVIDWISSTLRYPNTELEVHFHQGPESAPAVCYDVNCGSPRLDVGSR